MVEHGHSLRHSDRVVVGQDHHAEPKPNLLGSLAQGGVNELGAWRGRKPREEMVLDEPQVVETHLVRQDTLVEGLLQHQVVVQDFALHLVLQG